MITGPPDNAIEFNGFHWFKWLLWNSISRSIFVRLRSNLLQWHSPVTEELESEWPNGFLQCSFNDSKAKLTPSFCQLKSIFDPQSSANGRRPIFGVIEVIGGIVWLWSCLTHWPMCWSNSRVYLKTIDLNDFLGARPESTKKICSSFHLCDQS